MSEPVSIESARKKHRKPKPPLRDDGDDRPIIRVSPALYQVTDAAIAALEADATLFQRDGKVVRVVRIAESLRQARDLEGCPAIREASVATVREHLAATADWQRFDGRREEFVSTTPPSAVVQALVARGEYPSLRPLTGIAEAPFLRPDGTVCDLPGYDDATGYLYVPCIEFPPISACPTRTQAEQALADLREVWADFPFVDDHHQMVAIAALLTILARPAISGNVPACIITANTAGSGKTLAVDAVSMIATGRAAPKMTWADDAAELEKVLASFAMMGTPIVAFDNVSTPFGGAALDKVLTAGDTVQLRILGQNEVPALKWRSVVFATGNNVQVIGDTTRRGLMGRLETGEENPEERTGFNHHPLLPWVAENRGRLVAAALTVLRSWVVDGRQAYGCRTWGSFEAWSATVPPAIVYAGGADPMACRLVELGEESPDKAALRVVLARWPLMAPDGLTAKKAIEYLWPSELRGQSPCDGNDDLREALEVLASAQPGRPPAPRKLGDAFRKLKGRVVDGARLVCATDRTGIGVWSVSAGSAGSCWVAANPSRFRSKTSSTATTETDPATPSTPRTFDFGEDDG